MTTQIIFSQVPSYVPSNGLVGYWPFSGNANDLGGNNLTGSVTGASLAADRFGNLGKAYSFLNGNQFITLPAPPSNTFTNTMSYSLWYKEVPNTDYVNIFNTTNNKALVLNPNANGIRANDGNSFGLDANSSALRVNGWKHICIVYVGQVINIFLNGVLINSGTTGFPAIIQYNSTQSIVGSTYLMGGQYPFSGLIDDIAIYNRALTQQEITNMYNGVNYSDTCNAVSGSLTNGLVGYWPFCGNANDDSGNGNNGTVNGATLSTDRFGNNNSAYNFDGNSFISVPSTTELCLQNQFTISLWARRNNSTFMGLISKGRDNGGEGVSYHISGLENGAEVGINNDTGGCSSCNIGTTPYLSNNFSSWNHYVGIWDGIRLKFYENGIMVSDVNGVLGDGNALLNTNFPLLFGRWSLNNYLNGQLDDIGIWNRALTQQEITQLFNQNQCITNITVTDTLIINVGQLSYTNPVAYANSITIYPNPANTQVNIIFNNITDLTGGNINIINSLGQQVATTPITLSNSFITMPLNTWGGTGLYFVQILNAQGIVVDVKKIILQ